MIYLVTNSLELFNNELYTIISAEESLRIINQWEMVQFDIETTGLDPHICNILSAQFGNKKAKTQIVVDCTTIDITLYKNVLETKCIIGQNLKFDLQFLYNYHIIPRKIYDTMIVEQLLHLGYPSEVISYSLQSIAMKYLHIYIDKSVRGTIIYKGLTSDVIIYAAKDVEHLEDIMEKQIEQCLIKNCIIGAELECNFVPVIAYLEWCGIKLDVEKWSAKMKKDEENLIHYKTLLDQFVLNLNNPKFYTVDTQGDLFEGFNTEPKCNINWASSQQVIGVAQFLGFNTSIKNKQTGEDSESVLEKHLKGQKGINDEFLKIYFLYKEADKVCSTYGQKYINAINPITGRIHTVFRQLGASSGRMASGSKDINKDLAKLKRLPLIKSKKSNNLICSYPQLQNLPADEQTRSAFVPEENNKMCSSDFSALESRLGADIYNEHAMIHEFLHGSGDIHSLVAKGCFPKELEGIEVKDIKKLRPDLRNKAKAPEFACQFGGGKEAIKASLGCTVEEAQTIEDNYYNLFTGIATFKKKGAEFVRKNGYILMCKYTGHKMYWHDHTHWVEVKNKFNKDYWDLYRELKNTLSEVDFKDHPMRIEVSHNFKVVSKWERLALNAVTQGTGIIILKQAMIDFFNWILDNNYFSIVLLCNLVHDEAVIEFPKEMEDIVVPALVYNMENAASMYCKALPIPANAEVGDHWIH